MAPLLTSWMLRGPVSDLLYGKHHQHQQAAAQSNNITTKYVAPILRSTNPGKHMLNLLIGSEEQHKHQYSNKHLLARTGEDTATILDFSHNEKGTGPMVWIIFVLMVFFIVFVLVADVYRKSPRLQRLFGKSNSRGGGAAHHAPAAQQHAPFSGTPQSRSGTSEASLLPGKAEPSRPSTLDDAEKGQAWSSSVTPNGNEKGKENAAPVAVRAREPASAPTLPPMVNGDHPMFLPASERTEFSVSYHSLPEASHNGEGPSSFH